MSELIQKFYIASIYLSSCLKTGEVFTSSFFKSLNGKLQLKKQGHAKRKKYLLTRPEGMMINFTAKVVC